MYISNIYTFILLKEKLIYTPFFFKFIDGCEITKFWFSIEIKMKIKVKI